MYCKVYHHKEVTKDLGTIHGAGQIFKAYPCRRSNHAAIDCVLEIIYRHDVKYGDVGYVVLDVPPLPYQFAVGQPIQIDPIPQVNAIISFQCAVTNALIQKALHLEHGRDDTLKDPNNPEDIEKIRLKSKIMVC